MLSLERCRAGLVAGTVVAGLALGQGAAQAQTTSSTATTTSTTSTTTLPDALGKIQRSLEAVQRTLRLIDDCHEGASNRTQHRWEQEIACSSRNAERARERCLAMVDRRTCANQRANGRCEQHALSGEHYDLVNAGHLALERLAYDLVAILREANASATCTLGTPVEGLRLVGDPASKCGHVKPHRPKIRLDKPGREALACAQRTMGRLAAYAIDLLGCRAEAAAAAFNRRAVREVECFAEAGQRCDRALDDGCQSCMDVHAACEGIRGVVDRLLAAAYSGCLGPDGGVSCDDGSACTDDWCDGGACVNKRRDDDTPCESDGNPCTNDVCRGGACTHRSLAGTPCAGDDLCMVCVPDAVTSHCLPRPCAEECVCNPTLGCVPEPGNPAAACD